MSKHICEASLIYIGVRHHYGRAAKSPPCVRPAGCRGHIRPISQGGGRLRNPSAAWALA